MMFIISVYSHDMFCYFDKSHVGSVKERKNEVDDQNVIII